MGAIVCIFNPCVGCFEPIRWRVLVYLYHLRGLLLALTWARSCVFLTITWVVFSPYVGTCLCTFNPYVGCFHLLLGRVLVYF